MFSMFWNLFILSKISRQEVRRFTSELNVTVSYVARFIWNSLTFLNQEKKTSSVDIQSVAMIARALEIKEIYKQSFHVFLHAQNSGLLVIPDLIKEFIKAIDPQNCPHQFKFLRIPKEEPLWDITEYSEAENVDDCVNPAREDLLSVDGYFLHKENWESSIFFMKKNTNIMHSNLFLLESVISHFCPDLEMEKIQQFALRVSDITAQDNSKIGNLFLLCIPKEVSPKVQYRAHPFGNPCDCHSKEEDLDILEVLQNDQLSSEAICYGMDLPRNCNFQDESYDFEIPQYRLFTPELKPENGVKIYFIPSNKEYRDMVKMQIKTIVQEILSLKSVI